MLLGVDRATNLIPTMIQGTIDPLRVAAQVASLVEQLSTSVQAPVVQYFLKIDIASASALFQHESNPVESAQTLELKANPDTMPLRRI
jgi:hypothetical protein